MEAGQRLNADNGNGAIVVLGMHRSGTSAATGVLGLCGAWVGRPDELTGSGKQNPKGFFERKDLRGICDSLLHAGGFDWWKVAGFDCDLIPEAARTEGRRNFAKLAGALAEHGAWTIKEPRLCLLFPLLRPEIEAPVCVIVLRDPPEVAESLRLRNGIPLLNGLALWEFYLRSALAASHDLPRVFIRYDRLIADPVGETERLVASLEAHGVTGLTANPEVANFISRSLYRSRSQFGADLLSASERALWEAVAEDGAPAVADLVRVETTPRLLLTLADLEAVFGAALTHQDQTAQWGDERRAFREALSKMEDQRSAAETALREIKSQQGEMPDAILGRLGQTQEHLARLSTGLARATEVERALRYDLALSRHQGRSLRAELEATGKELAQRTKEAAQLRKATQIAQQTAEALSRTLEEVYASTSWRVTAPVRNLSDTVGLRKWLRIARDRAGETGLRPAAVRATRASTVRNEASAASVWPPGEPRVIVYTCIFGAYEALREPANPDPRVRWMLFTDDPHVRSDVFDVVVVTERRSSVRRTSRLPKFLPHCYLPPHDVSLYIDGSLMIRDPDVLSFVKKALGDADIALFRHHARSNVFEEIEICRNLGLERGEVCTHFEQLYTERGAPEDFPLFENMLIVRRNTPAVQTCNTAWWNHYGTTGAQRDQLSLALSLHETGLKPRPINHGKQVRYNDFVDWKKHKRTTLPAVRPRVFIFIPYAPPGYGQDLGRAYNDCMERLGPDDWAVFLDHDARFCGGHTQSLMNEIAQGFAGAEILITGLANRIGNPYQRVAQFEDVHDLAIHDAVADAQFALHRDTLHHVTDTPSTSGFIMMLSRKTWEKHRFIPGFLGVDNAMHKSFRGGNGHVYLAPALYAYHFYRADGDLSHAIRTLAPEATTGAAVAASTLGDSAEIVSARHAIRTFVISDNGGLELADYLPLLRPGEWAVFLSDTAIFAQKTWNRSLYGLVAGAPTDRIVCFNEIAGPPDHMEARVAAQEAEHRRGTATTESFEPGEEVAPAGFVVSFEAIQRLCSARKGHSDPALLPGLAARNGHEVVRAPGISIHVVRRQDAEGAPATPRPEIVERLRDSRRVAMLTLGFWPQQAGMEMVFHNLALRMTRAGDQVVLFTPKAKQPFEEIQRNYIIRRYKNEAHFHRLFHEHHASMPFDSILVQGAYLAASLALEAGDLHGVPVVLRTHGEDIQIDEEIGYGYRLDPSKAKVVERNIRRVEHNVAISEPIGKEVASIDHDGKVTVISNGVDTTHFTGASSTKIRDLVPHIADSTCILLTVGRNVKKKCFHLAVEALADLRARRLDVCLVYVGKPGSGKDLDALAEELGVADRFHPLGEMSYFELPEIYASADIFVFPSRLETFGNVTVEAMSSGLPCIEFDYLANREKIIEGETGRILPWGDVPALSDAIAELVEDPALRKRMSAAAHRVARETFDWAVIVERYRSVLRVTAGTGGYLGAAKLDGRGS
jgi:glycosyltransferase involved in cell wall biosynthesis